VFWGWLGGGERQAWAQTAMVGVGEVWVGGARTGGLWSKAPEEKGFGGIPPSGETAKKHLRENNKEGVNAVTATQQ